MNLEQTAITLSDQFGPEGEISAGAVDRFFQNLGKFAFGGLGAVFVIGIGYLLWIILTRFVLEGTQVTFGVFLMLFVVFAALSLTYVIYNESRKGRRAVSRDEHPEELAAPDTGKLLNQPSQTPIPSVIDDTTELLAIEAKTRKL